MNPDLVTPAAGLLVSVAEAKVACRIDDSIGAAEDDWLTRKIKAVTAEIEGFTGRSVQEQGWVQSLDAFSDTIELLKGPVSAVGSIKYDDADHAEQTLDSSVYVLDLVNDPQRVVLASGESWPALLDRINAVRIAFTAGFGEGPSLELIKDVCLDEMARRYDDRDACGLAEGSKARLRPLRRIVI